MNTNLSDEQIADYRRDGFVAQRGFLSADEVEALTTGVLEAISGMGRGKVAGENDGRESGESYYDNVFTQKLNLWRVNEAVKQVMLSPALGKMLSRLTGVDDGFRVWHDQALIKEPFANPTAWHLDNTYWSYNSPDSVSIWISLGNATLENGCMWFVPGSQKHASYDREIAGIGQNMGDLFRIYPEMAETDPVAVPMQPGDCSFHNGMAAHGAGANMTRERRMAMTCAYMPVGSTFNGNANILPRDYLATLNEGDVLENDDWNPCI